MVLARRQDAPGEKGKLRARDTDGKGVGKGEGNAEKHGGTAELFLQVFRYRRSPELLTRRYDDSLLSSVVAFAGERNASQGIALCTYRRWAGLIRFFVLLRSFLRAF